MRTETDPDYIAADSILEDGDSRWYRQRIAQSFRAQREIEREACAKVAESSERDHADCGHEPLYWDGRRNAAVCIRARTKS